MLRIVPLPRFRGGGQNDLVLATRYAPEGCCTTRQATPLSTIASRLNRRWDRLWLDRTQALYWSVIFSENRYPLFRIMLDKIKGSRTPPGAFFLQMSRISGCERALTRRARLTAFHRGTCGREPTPPLSSRTRFLGRGCRGRYPPSPVPVQRQSRRPVIMPAGRLPVSRPGAEVTSPCPREPLCPIGRRHPADVPYGQDSQRCNWTRDDCQDVVAMTVTPVIAWSRRRRLAA